MNTEQKIKLLTDVREARRALGRLLDGGHDLSQLLTFSMKNAETLSESGHTALFGLVLLDDLLTSEIGTDNL